MRCLTHLWIFSQKSLRGHPLQPSLHLLSQIVVHQLNWVCWFHIYWPLVDFLLLGSTLFFRDGPALHTLFSDAVAKGWESDSSAETIISDPQSLLWKVASEQLLEIGQTNPKHFHTIQSHIRELADVYCLKTSMSQFCHCYLLLFWLVIVPQNAAFEYPTNILLHMPRDIQKIILDNLAIPALLRLSKSCRYLCHAVNAYTMARIEHILTSFSTCVRGRCKHSRNESPFAMAIVFIAFYLHD